MKQEGEEWVGISCVSTAPAGLFPSILRNCGLGSRFHTSRQAGRRSVIARKHQTPGGELKTPRPRTQAILARATPFNRPPLAPTPSPSRRNSSPAAGALTAKSLVADAAPLSLSRREPRLALLCQRAAMRCSSLCQRVDVPASSILFMSDVC